MPTRGRVGRLLYLYAGVTSAAFLMVVIVMGVATRSRALVWRRAALTQYVPPDAQVRLVDTLEHQVVVIGGNIVIEAHERTGVHGDFLGRQSMSSLEWFEISRSWSRYGFDWDDQFHFQWFDSHSFVIVLPLWAIGSPLAILPGIQVVQLIRSRCRRRHIRLNKLCPDCGYDCRATPDRCPECGHVLRASSLVDVSAFEEVVDDEDRPED